MDPKDFEKMIKELSSLEDLIERALFAISDVKQTRYWCIYVLTTRKKISNKEDIKPWNILFIKTPIRQNFQRKILIEHKSTFEVKV